MEPEDHWVLEEMIELPGSIQFSGSMFLRKGFHVSQLLQRNNHRWGKASTNNCPRSANFCARHLTTLVSRVYQIRSHSKNALPSSPQGPVFHFDDFQVSNTQNLP